MQLIDIKPITTFEKIYKILISVAQHGFPDWPDRVKTKTGRFSPANHDHGRIFSKSIVCLNLNELYIYLNKYLEKFKIFSLVDFCGSAKF